MYYLCYFHAFLASKDSLSDECYVLSISLFFYHQSLLSHNQYYIYIYLLISRRCICFCVLSPLEINQKYVYQHKPLKIWILEVSSFKKIFFLMLHTGVEKDAG